MTRKYKIEINGQSQEFANANEARERVKKLLDANVWWFSLETEEVKK